MFVAYCLCSLYCCLHNFVPHITYLSLTECKLKTTCEACNTELGINHAKTHHVHQMIQYANNLILILFNIDET